jgi:hypothetical protein
MEKLYRVYYYMDDNEYISSDGVFISEEQATKWIDSENLKNVASDIEILQILGDGI